MESIRLFQILPITLIAVCMVGAVGPSPVFAAGVCREANCAGNAPKEDKCDRTALKLANQEYHKWMHIYIEQTAGAEDAEKFANESTDKALEDAREFYGELPEELANLPDKLRRDEYIEAMAKKAFGEKVAEAVGTGLAVEDLAKLLINQANVTAKEITAGRQAEANAAQAEKAAELAKESLKKAIEANKKWNSLEKQCEAKSKDEGPDAENGNDGFKPPGQRDLEAATKILNSWTKIGKDYIDAQGDFYTASTALQKALDIVQGNDGASLDDGFRFIRTGSSDVLLAAASGAMLSPRQVAKFRSAMGLALLKNALGWKALKKAKTELQKIHALRAR